MIRTSEGYRIKGFTFTEIKMKIFVVLLIVKNINYLLIIYTFLLILDLGESLKIYFFYKELKYIAPTGVFRGLYRKWVRFQTFHKIETRKNEFFTKFVRVLQIFHKNSNGQKQSLHCVL